MPQRPLPVIGPRLRRLLQIVFGLFGLLAVNSVYLGGVSFAEWLSGDIYQDYFYQLMFLVHLVAGLLIIVPVVLFGALHLRKAWSRPNIRAVRAGLGLYITALLVLLSGLVLVRFDFFAVKDPDVRRIAYWLHVVTPLVVMWLFVLHRLAGKSIRWWPAVVWAGAATAFLGVSLALQLPRSDGGAEESAGLPYAPALARIVDSERIPARALMMDDYCQECHADVHEQWAQSAHRFSSFNNPAYRFSVLETRDMAVARDGNVQVSRLCAVCHDPVPLFSGRFDRVDFDPEHDPTAQAGLTCSACHAITAVNSARGNGDYTIEAPTHYPFTYSDNAALQWINRQLVKAKPAFHKKTFLKPVHRDPLFCASCHKVHLPQAFNDYKWLRGQNHFDSYRLSGVSGHGASSFYYPAKAVHKCAACHMPLMSSDDFGAAHFDTSGELTVHNHLFVGANTALPHLRDAPDWVNAMHESFLEGAVRVDIFAIKDGGTISGPLVAPLRPQVPTLVPGGRYLLEVVVRTLKVGHLFTEGTADSNQIWLDVTARSGERVVGRSGGMGPDGEIDPWSYFLNAYVLDGDGNRIDRRNAQDIVTSLYNHQIPPGAADVVHYGLEIPEDIDAPVTVEVSVNYRKFDTAYMRHFQGDAFVRNDLPVTMLARDRLSFPVGQVQGDVDAAPTDVPPWERWNDYGIALLRKGKRGELRQAEAAFLEVERLDRADGSLNLARVYLREGRLDDAVAALGRAASHEPPAAPWLVAWLSGLVNKQNGYLDEAIDDFTQVLRTEFVEARQREFDFSQDYRVLNELGQTLFERAKQERGPARRARRDRYLREAADWFHRTLELEPENVTAHYNLALLSGLLGDADGAAEHRDLHDKYRTDDNARERVVAIHRRRNPAADHAAEPVVIYDLQRPRAYGVATTRDGEPYLASSEDDEDSRQVEQRH